MLFFKDFIKSSEASFPFHYILMAMRGKRRSRRKRRRRKRKRRKWKKRRGATWGHQWVVVRFPLLYT